MKKSTKKVWAVFIVTGLVFCPAASDAEDWQQVYSAEEPVKAVKLKTAADIITAPAGAIEPAAPEDKFARRISLDYKDTDLVNVLRSLAWTYGLNIVTSPDIKGKISISLKDVSIKDALSAILAISGLTYTEREDIIYIAPGDTKTIEFRTDVVFLNYLPARQAQDIIRKTLSLKGEIKTEETSNSVIITDLPQNIEEAKKLLKKIDIAPQQVLIEAKIVDITSSDLKQIGVTYTFDYSPGHGIFGRSTKTAEEVKGKVDMAGQSSSLTGGQFNVEAFTLKGLNVTATIDALAKDGKANLLASPSIAVLNGKEARIVIGERYPYKERTQTTSGTTETVKFVDIGTVLRVSPQINEDGYITMRVHPEVSSLSGTTTDASPIITTREADTTVRIKEGETFVIAGLIKQQDSRANEKIPILGDIPIIGLLFSRRQSDIEQKELAVFITPKILRSKEEIEVLGKRQALKEEAYVTIEKTGELNLIASLFEKAKQLEGNYGLVSRRKDEQFRMTQALSLYDHVYTVFPGSNQAPEAMYKASLIYINHFKDYKTARELLSRLISDYPGSSFREKAEAEIKNMQ